MAGRREQDGLIGTAPPFIRIPQFEETHVGHGYVDPRAAQHGRDGEAAASPHGEPGVIVRLYWLPFRRSRRAATGHAPVRSGGNSRDRPVPEIFCHDGFTHGLMASKPSIVGIGFPLFPRRFNDQCSQAIEVILFYTYARKYMRELLLWFVEE